MMQSAPLLTADEMRRTEQACIARGAATGATLMAAAADGVCAAIADLPGLHRQGSVVVICGPGNNGGDGYAVASRLHDAGWQVTVLALGTPGAATPDASAEATNWLLRGSVTPFQAGVGRIEADLAVDALFGTGLTRPLDAALADIWAQVVVAGKVLAVDAPSGLCLDTGRDLGVVARADVTVTFHAPKRGHYLGVGPDLCGQLLVHDIGCVAADEPAPPLARLASPDPVLLAKKGDAHKYDHGHALVLAGGVGKGGAGRLAARAALRAGAGLVTLGVPGAALIENAARLDAIMLQRLDDAAALEAVLGDRRISAVVLGPGLGVGARTREMVTATLGMGTGAVVLDADALTSFTDSPDALFALLAGRQAVLTPHAGEFARLFPDLAGQPGQAVEAVQAAAARSGAVVLLKGRATLIAAPDAGPVTVGGASYEQAAPWLATAGSGDVLAGLIGGLLARGLPAQSAAAQAVWLHAAAARVVGPGLIAEDLPEAVPRVLHNLGL